MSDAVLKTMFNLYYSRARVLRTELLRSVFSFSSTSSTDACAVLMIFNSVIAHPNDSVVGNRYYLIIQQAQFKILFTTFNSSLR